MPKSTTTANDTLDALLRSVDPSWRSGATRYVALHTGDPGNPATITPNSIISGDVEVDISGNGETLSILTRQ